GGALEEGSGHRERIGAAESEQGRARHEGPGSQDRRTEDAGSQHRFARVGDGDGGGRRAVDGLGGRRLMHTHGKKYNQAAKNRDVAASYQPRQALEIVKSSAYAKFDETVEVAVRLGVDPRHAD